MDKKIRNTLLFIAVIFVLVLINIIRVSNFKSRLIKSHIIICGKILDMRAGKGVNVIYTFDFSGKTYKFNNSSPRTTIENYKKGIDHIFLAVEKENPNNNRILADSEDFDDLEINSTDTVNIKCN